MNRRDFFTATGALGLSLPATGFDPVTYAASRDQKILELIEYKLHIGEKRNLVRDFYRDVAIPALNRTGIGPVGVFSVRYGENDPTLYVLLQHDTMDSVLMKNVSLLDDATFVQDGREFLEASQSNSAYVRSESTLMQAFSHLPAIVPPSGMMDIGSRVYEMRIYESHSVMKGKRKVHMFNEGGEIELFKKTGLFPVFFGETIVGRRMPNLTYLLAFESMTKRDENWQTFVNHPEWLEMRANPFYADTVSNITDIILSPASCSQV